MKTKFYEEAKVAFEKLSPEVGDTITVSFPKDMAMEQIRLVVSLLEQLSEEYSCHVMILGQGVQVSVLNEEDMASLGWVRAEPPHTLQ
jgi:hypothetical protein